MSNNYFSPTALLVVDGTVVNAADLNNPLNALETSFDKLPAPHASAPGTKGFSGAVNIDEPTNATCPVTLGGLRNNTQKHGTSGGTANAYTLTLSPVPAAYAAGMGIQFIANVGNTGASTININSLGVKAIVRNDGQPLVSGDIPVGGVIKITYDGTNFQIGATSTGGDAAAQAQAAAASAVSAAASATLAAAVANATVYNGATPRSFPDVVICTNGGAYLCLGTAVTGDDPTTSTTGNWLGITVLPHATLIVTGASTALTNANLQGITTVTNTGAVIETALLLPAGYAGAKGSCLVDAAQYLKLTANGAEKIKILGGPAAGNTYVRSNIPNTYWAYEWVGSYWLITELTGYLKGDE